MRQFIVKIDYENNAEIFWDALTAALEGDSVAAEKCIDAIERAALQ